jgi:LysR family transcriptional regulator, nitrogen assimilation regulatory protein
MTLTQLRYFVAVARSKSLSRAAAELRIAQPAITRQLKLLESELEAVLFTRHHRGVEITEAGRLLLDRAEFQIRSFDQIRGEFRALSFAPTGRVRIGCPPALTRPLLSGPLATFIRLHPNLGVEVRESISEQLVRAVLTDQIDIAIASTIAPIPHISSEVLFKERIWLFGPPKTRLAKRISLGFLSGVPLLVARRGNATRDLIERRMAEARLRPHVLVETDSTQLNEQLVTASAGYVVAPYSSLRDKLKAKLVSGAPIENLTIERALIRRKDRPLTRAVQEFLTLLRPEIARAGRRSIAG